MRAIKTSKIVACVGLAAFLFVTASCMRAEEGSSMKKAIIKDHVQYLASRELAGRGTGSGGDMLAADYIVKHFEQHGVEPVGESFLQEFEIISEVKQAPGNYVRIVVDGQSKSLTTGSEWLPLSSSASDTISGRLVFAGYGIEAPDKNYRDYKGVDVAGKIVVILRGSPDGENPHGDFAQFALVDSKLRTAAEKGAAGLILVNPSYMDDEPRRFRLSHPWKQGDIAAVSTVRSVIDEFLPSGKTLGDLEEKINATVKPASFSIPAAKVEIGVELTAVPKTSANVIGLVKGSDPARADEYIVLGAHYDHLGMGGHGSRAASDAASIHYGADDNASGTAAMMEVAARIAADPLPRSVLFMGFSGEEMGLIGSTYFCDNPTVPLDKIVTMVNLDMVGRMTENKMTVNGTGTSSLWDPLVDSLGTHYELKVSKSADGYGPSDHAAFYGRDIPVLMLFTGLHDDYHRPSDTSDKVNYEGLDIVANFAGSVLAEVGNATDRPDFIKVKSSANQGRSMMFKVWVGTIPDYSDHPKGMRITGVRDGSPAAKGGMQGNDVITKFGETTVKNIYDYTYALGKFKPGDEVKVTVLRGEEPGEEVELTLMLESRKE